VIILPGQHEPWNGESFVVCLSSTERRVMIKKGDSFSYKNTCTVWKVDVDDVPLHPLAHVNFSTAEKEDLRVILIQKRVFSGTP